MTQSDVSTAEIQTGQRRDSPYFGLDYFRVQDGAWFFGREAESDQVITNLQAARLTLLHAESGVGKSSLLRAGVAWRLRRSPRVGHHRRRPCRIRVVEGRPGQFPDRRHRRRYSAVRAERLEKGPAQGRPG